MWTSFCIIKEILVLIGRKCVVFLSKFSNKRVLHGSDQSHASNITAKYEVPRTAGNTVFKACIGSH